MFAKLIELSLFAQEKFDARMRSDRGATAVEYALMVALIAAVIIVTVTALGGRINTIFTNVKTALGG